MMQRNYTYQLQLAMNEMLQTGETLPMKTVKWKSSQQMEEK